MKALSKYSIITLFLICLILLRVKVSCKHACKIDADFTETFLIYFVCNMLEINKIGAYTLNSKVIDNDIMCAIHGYCDDKLINVFENITYQRINDYSELINNINCYSLISIPNNQIKTFLKQKKRNLNILDGSFTNFIVSFFDYDVVNSVRTLNKNMVENLVNMYIKIFEEVNEDRISEENILQYSRLYTKIADFYLNFLKLSIIDNLDKTVLAKLLRIDFKTLKESLFYMGKDEFIYNNNLKVALTLTYDLKRFIKNDEKQISDSEYVNLIRVHIIELKSKFFAKFIKGHLGTKNFKPYIKKLRLSLISRFKLYGINTGCTDIIFSYLHKILNSYIFKRFIEFPCLFFINKYYTKDYLVSSFVKDVELFNNSKLEPPDLYSVKILASFLTTNIK